MAKVFFLLVFVACISGSFAACNVLGNVSPAICVSKTQFVLGFQNPLTDTPQSCPPGTVCANVAEICTLDANKAECSNTVPGTTALCNACDSKVTEVTPVCVNQTAFTFCDQGKLLTNLVQTCGASTPYCKIVRGASYCTAEAKNLDCPASGGGSGTGGGGGTGTGTNTCTEAGFFPNTTDLTCTKYYKCQQNAQGTLEKIDYTCSTTDYVFNPTTKKCVAKSTYTCPNK